MARRMTLPNTYAQALDMLNGRDSRKVAHNTYLERHGDPIEGRAVGLRYHSTTVALFTAPSDTNPEGFLVLNTGGWHTVTTKARLRDVLPDGVGIYSDRRVWYVVDNRERFRPEGVEPHDKRLRVPYEDGMVVDPLRSLHGLDRGAPVTATPARRVESAPRRRRSFGELVPPFGTERPVIQY